MRCWLIVSPRPDPPAAAPDFVCVKASKIARARGLDADAGVAHFEEQPVLARLGDRQVHSPRGVNLIALLSR
jgi:hypothetical protein